MDQTLPTLAARRLLLRPLVDGDVPALLELYGDPRVARYLAVPRLRDEGEARAFLGEIDEHVRHRTLYQWALAGSADGRFLGSLTLAGLDWTHRRAEVGFALAPAHWGRGLMREALGRLVEHAFGELGLHRLEADVDPRNGPSLRLLEGLGFRREGYLRERYRQDGEWQHALLFGLLEGEWRGVSGGP